LIDDLQLNQDLFERINNAPDDREFLVSVSYLELYNEKIYDLLNPSKREDREKDPGLNGNLVRFCKVIIIIVREHPKLGVYVENLIELVANSAEEINRRMDDGNAVRHVAATKMNDRSSRSHSVFTVKIAQKVISSGESEEAASNLTAKINLVDLAGSERVAKTEAEGSTLKEATMINKRYSTMYSSLMWFSLSVLGTVINALADPKKRKEYIPFRDSKLTRLLQESLGGNTVTIMLAAVGPADRNYDETLNTLQYASRAKNIQNTSKKNETNPAKIVKELREEIERLKVALQKGGGDPQEMDALQTTISTLEYAKKQTWVCS
jgi:hypothetical protein